MDIGDRIQLAILVAAVSAVVFTNRATRRQLMIQTFSDYTKRYQEIILHFPEDINASQFKLGVKGEPRYEQTMRYIRT